MVPAAVHVLVLTMLVLTIQIAQFELKTFTDMSAMTLHWR